MDSLNTYLDRAWKDLSSDDGWWKTIIAFGLLNCIPLFGQIIMFGYLFDWAKEAAWGMDIPLSRQLGNFRKRFTYGLIALWVLIIWLVPLLLVSWLVGFIPVVGGVLEFLIQVCIVLLGAVAVVAVFRSLIYEHVMPGLQFKRVFSMVREDPSGLMQCFGIFLLNIPLLLAALFILLLPTVPFINLVATTTLSAALGADLALLIFLGMLTVVIALLVWVIGAIISAFICTLYIRSMGYWVEQFKPADWRSPAALAPFEVERKERKQRQKEQKKEEKLQKKQEKKQKKKKAKEPEQTASVPDQAEQSIEEKEDTPPSAPFETDDNEGQ